MNRKIALVIFLLLQLQWLQAQFIKASLQATGLTCAMCSNAINNALRELPFVESVKSDIKNSSFSIVFKTGVTVNPDAIKNAVEEAGFFVGGLKVTGSFNAVAVDKDGLARIGNDWYRFVRYTGSVLTGEQTIRLLDKPFLTAKEFKKISGGAVSSLQTGKADASLEREGLKTGERIYHVSI